ncbi:MAG: PQQ-binding-like beta-propeller repeat protein [Candidatus Latescibacteria bacterium]|nr:PQQ-binding-like beta-propeller repeat protein [Candidatus Latescibacterota bacterium]
MKKWQKWSLGIVGIFVAAISIAVVIFWPTISILKGTGKLNDDTEAIPSVASRDLKPMEKGNADWISWYGANGDNRSKVKGIIKDWSGGLKKLWEVNYLCQGNLSATWSAPVIQGNRLVVCGRDTDKDLVFCLDPVDGSLLWKVSYMAKTSTSHGSGPRATPYIDDDRVYTFGRSGDLYCWSLFDGKQIWKINVSDEGGKAPQWGHASSPLVLGNLVLVQGGGSAGTIAYEKATGKLTWKSGHDIAGYAALVEMNFAGESVILAFHGKGISAQDAGNGSELWNVPWETSYDVNATTPIVFDDKIFITSGYGTGCELLRTNRSGADILWRNEIFSSIHSDPYVIDGFLYGYSGDSSQNKGKFKCINLQDGTEQWSTNDMGWGTCVLVDGYLLCIDIKGNLFLMKPDPYKFVKVSELPKALGNVSGPVWTKPVLANDHLYLRFKQRLVCYEIVKH